MIEAYSQLLLVKLSFTAFMLIMIPVYLKKYGWTNFLYFCDMALILTLIGIWSNNSLLISMSAVGIIAPQMLWVVDFIGKMLGIQVTGMTDYMFNSSSSKFLRGLSLFHGWFPFLLIYLVSQYGYDPNALFCWTLLSWVLIFISFRFLPPPNKAAGLTPVNVNYVWGLSDSVPQQWVSKYQWLAFMIIGLPIVFFIPAHYFLKALF